MRVLDLYIQLRNFRAWSKVHRAKYVPRHMGDAFYAQTLALQKEASFAWWHRWATRKRHLPQWVTCMSGYRLLVAYQTRRLAEPREGLLHDRAQRGRRVRAAQRLCGGHPSEPELGRNAVKAALRVLLATRD